MPKKIIRAKRGKQTSGGNLTDAEIKARNEKAQAAFRAARSAARRGFDQSQTKIRTDGKGVKITGGKGSDPRNAAAARSDARREGTINPLKEEKPFRAGRIDTSGSSEGADPYGSRARSIAPKKSKKKSLDSIQAQLQGMLVVVKEFQAQSTQARTSGTNVGTKIRQRNTEGSNKRQVKEVPIGEKLNLQSTIGHADAKRRKPTGKLVKSYSFKSLETGIDKLKSILE